MNNAVYKNASIVTGLSVAERGLGFLYRIVLSRYIGAEGLGLYQVAHSILFLFSTLAAGGIPVTVSRMVAKAKAEGDEKGERAVLSAGLVLCIVLSLPVCLIFGLFGEKMTFLFSDIRSAKLFKILLVGLCFSSVYAVIRGYFWGNKKFLTASLLETSEEIIMVLLGVSLLSGVASPLAGAEKAAWALTVADICSCGLALACLFFCGGKFSSPKPALKPLFTSAMPITGVRASGSLVTSAVAVLLPAMLVRAGFDEGEALALFGVVSGMVMPVLFIPSTLIGSLALVLVPELSQDYHRRNELRLKKNIHRGLTFAFLIACALIPFFFVLGGDMGRLAFASAPAEEIIVRSCIVLLPMSLTMISTSILNSIGFEKQTFIYFFFGAAALLSCIILLPPVCGIYAYAVGLGASYAVTALCNLLFLRKQCPYLVEKRDKKRLLPLLFALLSILPLSLFGQLCHALFQQIFGEILCLVVTALLLFFATLVLYFSLRLLSWESVKNFFRRTKKRKVF